MPDEPRRDAEREDRAPEAARDEGGNAEVGQLEPEMAELLEDLEIYEMNLQAYALEEEIGRLEKIVIPALERQAEGVEQLEREVATLFVRAYKDPELAKATYDQVAILEGREEAQRRLEVSPGDYGDLKAGSVFRPGQRRDVQEALNALAHRGEAYHRALEAAERSGLEDGELFSHEGSRAGERGYVVAAPEVDGRERRQAVGQKRGGEPARSGAAKRDAFDRALERLYVDAGGAQARFEQVERRLGTGRAAYGLANNPEGLGRVREEVAHSAAVREQYARAAALAALDLQRARERTEKTSPERYAGLEAARDHVTRLRAQVDELSQRVRERTAANGRTQGMSLGEQRRSINERLRGLDAAQLRRLDRALESNRGRVQGTETRGRKTIDATRTTVALSMAIENFRFVATENVRVGTRGRASERRCRLHTGRARRGG